MILLIFPTMATKTKRQKRYDECFAKFTKKPEADLFWKMFKENNIKMRRLFF